MDDHPGPGDGRIRRCGTGLSAGSARRRPREVQVHLLVRTGPDRTGTGNITCAIRAGSFPSPLPGGGGDPNTATSGLPDAQAFFTEKHFFWYLKDTFGTIGGKYPPNPGASN
ncbi:hypothetical protein [Nocardia pseudobrasiliensis]|uniref:hypothetical protein n=1 Tax=Nocardia pseudobrasiliensis TaxID=45979 RepID=UPI0012E93918|nr:hypothetical protein [Nocardia pseudobrasiliensis]